MENSPTGTAAAEKLPDPAGVTPRFAGKAIELGGKTYIVPGLSLRHLRDLRPALDRLETLGTGGAPFDANYFDTILELVLPALQRNYPAVTRDELEDLMDLNNVFQLSLAVMGRALPAPAQ